MTPEQIKLIRGKVGIVRIISIVSWVPAQKHTVYCFIGNTLYAGAGEYYILDIPQLGIFGFYKSIQPFDNTDIHIKQHGISRVILILSSNRRLSITR